MQNLCLTDKCWLLITWRFKSLNALRGRFGSERDKTVWMWTIHTSEWAATFAVIHKWKVLELFKTSNRQANEPISKGNMSQQHLHPMPTDQDQSAASSKCIKHCVKLSNAYIFCQRQKISWNSISLFEPSNSESHMIGRKHFWVSCMNAFLLYRRVLCFFACVVYSHFFGFICFNILVFTCVA